MNSSNIFLIIAAEIALLLLVVCIFLGVQNRSLKKLIEQLKGKAKSLLDEVKKLKQEAKNQSEGAAGADSSSYLNYVEEKLAETIEHHGTLNSNQPIALDIEPGSPLPHRTAALRHAIMLAEKDAYSEGDSVNWRVLRERYDHIFSFYEDFQTENTNNSAEFDELHSELQSAKKRISNLEKFKQLYFDLEEQWNNSKADAAHALNNLSVIASEMDETGQFNQALDDYHASYDGVSALFDANSTTQVVIEPGEGLEVSEEVKQLRSVAADQHRIIQGLRDQLMNANNDSEREHLVNDLQNELQKQARFIQESETCIQLLEDELNGALSELEQLKAKNNQLPRLKTELVSLRKESDALELKYHNVVSDNRRLQKQMKEFAAAKPAADAGEASKLKKQLSALADRYNDLEERFLDLKMQK